MVIRKLALPVVCTIGTFALGWFLRGALRTAESPAREPSSRGEDPNIAKLLWPDRTHEVQVALIPHMHEEDVYHLGTWPDRDNPDPDFRVSVKSSIGPGAESKVEVEHSNGFGHRLVTLRFDAVTRHVQADVESHGDAYPQPPDRWEDVNGVVYVSDMEWGLGHAVILDYSLYGIRGGERQCVHDKVSVDL